jgi:hypothetical protein
MSIYEDDNWRNDPGLKSKVVYKRKFALLPKKCEDGTIVWLGNYYIKYIYWGFKGVTDYDGYNLHTDICESVTEAEYIVRKLTEGL